MTFAHSSGVSAHDAAAASVTRGERRWIRATFVTPYLMLRASFETGGSSGPLILSRGLAAKYTLPARLALGAAFALFILLGFSRPVRRHGVRAFIAPPTLCWSTHSACGYTESARSLAP